MKRTDWIQNRVEWRLSRHSGVECIRGEEIPSAFIEKFTDHHRLPIGRPLLAFVDSDERWTILASEAIGSYYEGVLRSIAFHSHFRVAPINELIVRESGEEVKQNLQYLKLKSGYFKSIYVWAPSGSPYFALWNILNMFPFK